MEQRLKLYKHSLKCSAGEWEYRTLMKWSAVPAQAHKWTQGVDSDLFESMRIERAELKIELNDLRLRLATLGTRLAQNLKDEKRQKVDVVDAWKRFDANIDLRRQE